MDGYKFLNIIFIILVDMILDSERIMVFLSHYCYYFNFILSSNFKYDNIY